MSEEEEIDSEQEGSQEEEEDQSEGSGEEESGEEEDGKKKKGKNKNPGLSPLEQINSDLDTLEMDLSMNFGSLSMMGGSSLKNSNYSINKTGKKGSYGGSNNGYSSNMGGSKYNHGRSMMQRDLITKMEPREVRENDLNKPGYFQKSRQSGQMGSFGRLYNEAEQPEKDVFRETKDFAG